MKILIIEDDEKIASYLAHGLREVSHAVDVTGNGREGLFLAASGSYDVLVIDRLVPDLDGIGIVRALRSSGSATPVMFLTALGRVDQRVEGFEVGGDDYLVKPFAFSEFLARIMALARRPPLSAGATVLRCGGLLLDRLRRQVSHDGQAVDLQAREFALLEILMLNAGTIVTRTMLLEKVWDFHFDPGTNIVETHISRLRAKLGMAKELIHTVRGSGYVVRETA